MQCPIPVNGRSSPQAYSRSNLAHTLCLASLLPSSKTNSFTYMPHDDSIYALNTLTTPFPIRPSSPRAPSQNPNPSFPSGSSVTQHLHPMLTQHLSATQTRHPTTSQSTLQP
ncbi:hypothetical protein PMIN06_000510 [Paraphaeosphaeria minitans]